MEAAIDAACSAVAARLEAGPPRGVLWWKDGVQAYWCDQCTYFSKRKDHMVTHAYTHTGEKPHKCSLCDHATTTSQALLVHIRHIHTGEKPYNCDLCDYSAATSGSIDVHKRTHATERPYTCDVCNHSSTQNSALKRHMRIHTGERPYRCAECDYTSADAGHLIIHKRRHTGERPYKCHDCDAAFVKSSYLKTHKRTHTGEKPYKCPHCDYACSDSPKALRLHVLTHTGEKPHECTVCSYTCTTISKLRMHVRVHTNERPYQCNECDFTCARSGGLNLHKRTHNGYKPYRCKQCSFTCALSGGLKIHIRTHTGNKPYRCSDCDYRCTQSGALVRHTRVNHTGEKPYVCTMCNHACAQLGNLKRHIQTHTGPFCANPDCCKTRVIVKNEGDICGLCARGYQFGAKEHTVFAALINADERFSHFVRDKALGCGTRRRPDAYADIHIECQNVLFIIEVDEFEHRGNSPECELTRLEELQVAHGGALYVMRMNPDAPGGLEEENLILFAERCVDILETDHAWANEEGEDEPHIMRHPGRVIEYWGYKQKRIDRLRAAFMQIQS